MASQTSPADPLFYLHHCMVDRLWATWQINNPGADQYSLDDEDDYPTYDDTFVAAGESMFGGAIGAGVTPASMLDHRALGYYYDRDDALEARVIERGLPEIVSGDPLSVELETPQIVFNDVPEDETTKRAALFRISGCGQVTFRVLSGPSEPFALFAEGPFSFPSGGFPTDELRIWFLYTAGAAGTMDSGTVSIAAEDAFGNEIGRWEDVPLIGNAVARERVAVVAVLDESGSMLYDAGNNRTRLEALKLAANAFIDQLYDDNGLALVEFADDATHLAGLQEAGSLNSVTRNNARTEVRTHGPPDPSPHTSIGAGLEAAADVYATSAAASDYDVQATLVFTDGVEDRAPFIDEVGSAINERVYAIGVAGAANVDSDNLRAIADNSGGFMLVTGALAPDDEFLLEKFFIQVLAGVVNRDIVRDPPGWIVPGEVERVPFHIARSDIAFDAVALSRAPQHVVLGLRAPDGTLISRGQVPAEAYRIGSSSGAFCITLPLVVDGKEHWEGEWQLLLGLQWKRHTRAATHAAVATTELGQSAAVPYQALVHARSNLHLRARVDQSGLAPGSDLILRARLTEYGEPLETAPTVHADIQRPDGTQFALNLEHEEPGRFTGLIVGDQSGVYRFRVVAEGFTARGHRFTREHLLSAVVGRSPATSTGRGSTGDHDALGELLHCLLQRGVVDERFEKRLRACGIDVDRLRECVARLGSAQR